jgi:hypothetical protein
MTHLTHIDLPRNMTRIFSMDIQADLIDVSGHIGRGDTLLTAFFLSHRQAAAMLVHNVFAELRRGHTSGGSHGP